MPFSQAAIAQHLQNDFIFTGMYPQFLAALNTICREVGLSMSGRFTITWSSRHLAVSSHTGHRIGQDEGKVGQCENARSLHSRMAALTLLISLSKVVRDRLAALVNVVALLLASGALQLCCSLAAHHSTRYAGGGDAI